MKSIKGKKDLPYPIKLINDVAKIRFGKEYDENSELSLNEMIIMCNLIEGMIRVSDHYILMEDSLEIFQAIIKHGIYTNSYTYNEFYERKKNRAYIKRSRVRIHRCENKKNRP